MNSSHLLGLFGRFVLFLSVGQLSLEEHLSVAQDRGGIQLLYAAA